MVGTEIDVNGLSAMGGLGGRLTRKSRWLYELVRGLRLCRAGWVNAIL